MHEEPDTKLRGRTAIITGGGTGIGFAIASHLASAGAETVLVGRRVDVLEDAARDITMRTGRRSVTIAGDVRDESTMLAAFEAAVSSFGGLNILVNNAGGQFIAPAELLTRNGWSAVVDVALNATFFWSQHAAQLWIEEESGGAILNVVGPFRDRATPGIAHSGAARAAVVQLAKTLSVEWAPFGVRVNNIGPAVLTTGMQAELAGGSTRVVARLEERLPAGRWGTEDEVGALALFLLSDAAAFITGETVVMDGATWQGEGLGMRPPSRRRWIRDPEAAARRDWAEVLFDEARGGGKSPQGGCVQ